MRTANEIAFKLKDRKNHALPVNEAVACHLSQMNPLHDVTLEQNHRINQR
ncbi:MAG: hypothetical protein ACI37U_11255 [Bacteroides sp.]